MMRQRRLEIVRDNTVTKAEQKQHGRSLAKGIAAGLVGGLVATAARSLSHKVYPPRRNGEPERPELPSGQPTGYALALRRVAASPAMHWGLGAAAGAAYGAVAEYYPQATSRDGASFGMTLAAASQDGALAALGLAAAPAVEHSTREKSSDMASFIVFGIVTETVRRVVRRLI
ncbi:DUF1440 domain-containing protein [Edaphobacter bradus]|uniref:DUF1440 domain-containing protein n=1 Tax=Edaphobacter bradus TaxID=2259016 RepID=UPI0021E0586A|nr:DUF1440 domain-containing protein [Edaphobacter bradus]